MLVTRTELEQKAAGWLKQGISPGRLAITLAIGFTVGCLPVVGITTITCTILALTLGLNLPIIQAANYSAMPVQLLLIVPFLKLGARVLAFSARPSIEANILPMLPATPLMRMAMHASSLAGQATVGWLVVALPAATIMSFLLYAALKRVPALKNCEG